VDVQQAKSVLLSLYPVSHSLSTCAIQHIPVFRAAFPLLHPGGPDPRQKIAHQPLPRRRTFPPFPSGRPYASPPGSAGADLARCVNCMARRAAAPVTPSFLPLAPKYRTAAGLSRALLPSFFPVQRLRPKNLRPIRSPSPPSPPARPFPPSPPRPPAECLGASTGSRRGAPARSPGRSVRR